MKNRFTQYAAMLICALALTLSSVAQDAKQGVANKINNTNKKINNTDSAVTGTSSAINGTSGVITGAGNAIGNLGGSIAGLFKKKQKANASKGFSNITDSTAVSAARTGNENAIVISIAGVDYAKLKKLTDSLKAVAGVQSVNMTYSSARSSLNILYNKKAGDLWDGLSDAISKQYNIISLNDTAISITYKP